MKVSRKQQRTPNSDIILPKKKDLKEIDFPEKKVDASNSG
jgi:hypothetical protein